MKKKNFNRFSTVYKFLTCNFIKKCNIFDSVFIRQNLIENYKKYSRFYLKTHVSKRYKILKDVMYNSILFSSFYKILSTKKCSHSDNIFGLVELNVEISKKIILLKQKYFNNDYFRSNKYSKLIGSLCFIKLFWGFDMLSEYSFSHLYLLDTKLFGVGSRSLLFCLPTSTMCYNVKLNNKRFFLASAAGSFVLTLAASDEMYYGKIQYPSGLIKKVSLQSFCIVGRSSNLHSRYKILGKASKTFFLKKKRQSVRGVAMNPVDHPNGGSSKIKKPFLSPWGWVAKNGK